ncbi:MAG: hypothetical protein MUF19_01400 [Candidatus Pacebacteria bacterium]|jgi:hypothetical protein|nr:hypothetical protein [Candidatus Paceibacterota bacterium]
MELELGHLEQINNILIRKLSVTPNDPCYCGSSKIHAECCAIQPNFWISKTYFEKVIGFAKHNNFFVKSIPSTFLNDFNTKFYNKFSVCANPECNNPSIGSHIFGESLIRKHFNGNKCKWYLIDDNKTKVLCEAGISNDIKYPIFCEDCDNDLFKVIDAPGHSISDNKNITLHLLRCMSFQFQFTRTNLAMAHQLAFGSTIIALARQNHTGIKKDEQINIDHLILSFVNYKYHSRITKRLLDICINHKTTDKVVLYTRVISVKEQVFAQGILNPKQDLIGNNINFVNDASIMYVVLPKDITSVSITIATLDNEYHEYIEQLNSLNEYDFKKLINSYISPKHTQYNLLLSPDHKAHQKVLR